MLIIIVYMLDPRTKFEYFEFITCKMYGDTKGAVVAHLPRMQLLSTRDSILLLGQLLFPNPPLLHFLVNLKIASLPLIEIPPLISSNPLIEIPPKR